MLFFKQFFRGVKRKTAEALSLERLSEQYHTLMVNYVFLMAYATLESVFVNTLLYRVRPDISIVILYRGITYVASAVTIQIAAYLAQKKTPIVVIRTGGALYLLMYAVLFFGLDHMQYCMYLTATLAGAAGAFYWTGHNVLVSHYTTRENRDVGIAVLGVIQGVAALFVPVISGFVISAMPNPNLGYRVMFGVGMLLAAGQVYFQRRLEPVAQARHESKLKLALKLYRKKASYRLFLVNDFLRGFRDGTFGFILSMLLFQIIMSETLIGINSFLTGVLSITGSWAYGKLVTPSTRARACLIAALCLIGGCSLLFVSAGAPAIILFSVLNAFFAFFIGNSCGNCTFDVVTQNETTRSCVGEALAIRELALALGRVGGLFVMTVFPATITGKVAAMMALTASQVVMAGTITLTQRSMRRERRRKSLPTPSVGAP